MSSIGIAAKAGKAKGTLMIEVVGIKSKEVTTLLPLPSEINQTTIQNAMQALATIKSKIYDTGTDLYPQVMAIRPDASSKKQSNSEFNDSIITDAVENGKLRSEILLQIGNSASAASNKFQSAKIKEREAFDFLFGKKVNEAIDKFEECDKIYPGFHTAYDIAKFLKTEKQNLSDIDAEKWKDIYSVILKKYSWKLPDDILIKLKTASKD